MLRARTCRPERTPTDPPLPVPHLHPLTVQAQRHRDIDYVSLFSACDAPREFGVRSSLSDDNVHEALTTQLRAGDGGLGLRASLTGKMPGGGLTLADTRGDENV